MSADPFKKVFESFDVTRDLTDAEIDRLVREARLSERLKSSTKNVPHGPRLRPWRRVAIISTAAVLVLGGAAAAITLLRSPVTNTIQMSCYSQDSVHSKIILEMPLGPHPLASCETQLHWKVVPTSLTPSGLLCVLPNGTLGGFPPSKEHRNCASIGLVMFSNKIAHPEVLAFEEAAHRYFANRVCPGVLTARHEMLDLTSKYGIQSWRVRVLGSTNSDQCATLDIQPTRHLVEIVSVNANNK